MHCSLARSREGSRQTTPSGSRLTTPSGGSTRNSARGDFAKALPLPDILSAGLDPWGPDHGTDRKVAGTDRKVAASSRDQLLGEAQVSRRSSELLGQAQAEPFAFMKGLKVTPLPEGVSDSPLRAFSRLEQSIIESSLYPSPEGAASLEEQRRAYAVQPEHTPIPRRQRARAHTNPEAASGKLEAAGLAQPTVQFLERPRTSGSTPSLRGLQARQAREAARSAGVDPSRSCRGRAATAVTPISQAQRTPAHPALRSHRQKAAPALSDAQNVAEDLWEDLCSTLREL